MKEGVTNVRVAMEDSGATVTHEELPDLMTDETQWVQVFQNLVGNAIKYHRAGAPLIHVSAKKTGTRMDLFRTRQWAGN